MLNSPQISVLNWAFNPYCDAFKIKKEYQIITAIVLLQKELYGF